MALALLSWPMWCQTEVTDLSIYLYISYLSWTSSPSIHNNLYLMDRTEEQRGGTLHGTGFVVAHLVPDGGGGQDGHYHGDEEVEAKDVHPTGFEREGPTVEGLELKPPVLRR